MGAQASFLIATQKSYVQQFLPESFRKILFTLAISKIALTLLFKLFLDTIDEISS